MALELGDLVLVNRYSTVSRDVNGYYYYDNNDYFRNHYIPLSSLTGIVLEVLLKQKIKYSLDEEGTVYGVLFSENLTEYRYFAKDISKLY